MIITQIYILVCILFLAGKDASSYKLKDKNNIGPLTDKRIKRWHRDGVALWLLITLAPVYYQHLYWIMLYSLLIRLSVFDLAFNYWAGLPYKYLGSTALADKLFSKIFGLQGAVKKSLFFLAILITLNILIK